MSSLDYVKEFSIGCMSVFSGISAVVRMVSGPLSWVSLASCLDFSVAALPRVIPSKGRILWGKKRRESEIEKDCRFQFGGGVQGVPPWEGKRSWTSARSFPDAVCISGEASWKDI
jgi:hypothetical protein